MGCAGKCNKISLCIVSLTFTTLTIKCTIKKELMELKQLVDKLKEIVTTEMFIGDLEEQVKETSKHKKRM